jgi:hypothetical protein
MISEDDATIDISLKRLTHEPSFDYSLACYPYMDSATYLIDQIENNNKKIILGEFQPFLSPCPYFCCSWARDSLSVTCFSYGHVGLWRRAMAVSVRLIRMLTGSPRVSRAGYENLGMWR